MKLNHLGAACAALGLAAILLLMGYIYAQWLEKRTIHAAATDVSDQMTIGEAFLQEAVRQPDLLVVLGSSELLAENGANQANHFFQTYPTGFNTFIFAREGMTSLNMAQVIAAAGPGLRGKKVVISFSPSMFSPEAALDKTYPGNFSRMHAAELVFNARLSWSLKKDLATRMLQYPETLEKDPLLQFALNKLASGRRRDRLQYFAVLPLGKLDVAVLRLQDHWEAVKYIWGQAELGQTGMRKAASIDWATLAKQAEDAHKPQANNNPFGFDNQVWDQKFGNVPAQRKPGSGDGSFVMKLAASPEWDDLELLLRTLKEMGADSLVLSRPYSGLYYDYEGISIKARTIYYDTVQKKAAAYGIPVIDFRSHDSELFFNRDATSHTSPKGWVFVNQALDAFYHSEQ